MAFNELANIDKSITRRRRESLLGQRGAVVWFTGLSGAGKSTLANALEEWLNEKGKLTYLLDGDIMRTGLSQDLGFSHDDRMENIRRIAEVSKILVHSGVICISAFISPYRESRELARRVIGEDDFYVIYVSTPLAVCEGRDPKGLYMKARQGVIPEFTGVSSPYEEPVDPNLILDTSQHDIDACLKLATEMIRAAGVIG